MFSFNINISKARVLDEVQKTSEYISAKSVSADDPGAYERVRAVGIIAMHYGHQW